MTALPLSVIGGYLGAGKTTLINRLLAAGHGRRLAILVNDFGAINIDAALLQSASEDTIELTNGCVCCTMSGDLFFTIGDLLDRDPRPDHVIVEASGIADPAKIAAVSLAEKELRYSGIVTVVDGLNIAQQLADARISQQVKGQLDCADLLVISKVGREDDELVRTLRELGIDQWVGADDLPTIMATLLGEHAASPKPGQGAHPGYVQWSDPKPSALTRPELDDRLTQVPPGVLRVKALLPNPAGGFWEVHLVGSHHEITAVQDAPTLGLVAIGIEEVLSPHVIRDWWQG